MYSHNSICFSHIFSQGVSHASVLITTSLYFALYITGCFTGYFTGFCDLNSSTVIHIYFHRVIHTIPYFLLQSKVVSQAVSHAFLNSTLSGNFSHNFSHGKISCPKAVFTSQDISQGVSHAKKIHMVFTWFSHTFHRVAPSSVDREPLLRVYIPELNDFTNIYRVSVRKIMCLRGKSSGAVIRLREIINSALWASVWLSFIAAGNGWFFISKIYWKTKSQH